MNLTKRTDSTGLLWAATWTASLILCSLRPGIAQQVGDAEEGRAISSAICSECHAVLLGQPFSPRLEAPRFEDIANTPRLTTNMLVMLLQTSHPTMPNIVMTETEMANVIEYIRSLKAE
jgi:mono/diheme cytochrome c family protein